MAQCTSMYGDKQITCKHIQAQLVDRKHSDILQTEPDVAITSDASLSGWSCACNGVQSGGSWLPVQAMFHMNYLELFTNDCESHHDSVQLIKFADDTTLEGLISSADESAY